MKIAPLLMLTAILAGPARDDETQRAIAAIEKVKGKVVRDAKSPGQPVVSVNL